MLSAYVLAHFDDEYAALPLILRDRAAGAELHFFYNMAYRTPGEAQIRAEETGRFLRRFGIVPRSLIHLGRQTGVLDGELHRGTTAAYAALKGAVARLGKVDRFVTTAWEGGHPDHDLGAAMTARLAAELGGAPIEQFSLYNAPDLPWILYHGARPLPQNGPVHRMRLTIEQRLRWATAVSDYRSQIPVFLGLWPAMATTLLRQGDFRWQDLQPGRIDERPHSGPLHYERMFKVPYEIVRAAADSI